MRIRIVVWIWGHDDSIGNVKLSKELKVTKNFKNTWYWHFNRVFLSFFSSKKFGHMTCKAVFFIVVLLWLIK